MWAPRSLKAMDFGSLYAAYLFYIYLSVCMHATKVSRQFSRTTYLIPPCGIELRSLCLAAGTFTCWAIFLFHLFVLLIYLLACRILNPGLCYLSAIELKLWHFIHLGTIPNFKGNLYLKFVSNRIFLCCMSKHL